MKLTRLVAVAAILGSLGAGTLSAQTRPGSEPAEFPPASYKGKQYVDSQGCVFIRAGIDGNVSWIPRVTRSRTGVCGFKPTFAGQVAEAAPAEPAPGAASVTQITNPPPATKPIARPAAAARTAPAPKPAPKAVVVRQVAKRPAPVVETAPSLPVGVAGAQRATTACPDASPLSQQYLQRGKLPVRCGPQADGVAALRAAAAPTRRVKGVSANAPIAVSPERRIVPRHLAVNRANTTNLSVPKGYKRVWDDGRLNPRRAEQSLAGHRAMTLIWTSTVPRRLINQATGRDVTAREPLVYPYVDYERQQRELGEVTIVRRNGQIVKRIRRNAAATAAPAQIRQTAVTTPQSAPTYSTRSVPSAPPKAATRAQPKGEVVGKGYVQAGAFTDPAAAQAQARRIQRMGLPVRIGRYTAQGETTRLVIAGPFGGARAVDVAIAKLRSAGFKAFAR